VKENLSAVDQATMHVCQAETLYMEQLMLEVQHAQKQAELCGCPNCKKYLDGLIHTTVPEEIIRLTPPSQRDKTKVIEGPKEIDKYDPDSTTGLTS